MTDVKKKKKRFCVVCSKEVQLGVTRVTCSGTCQTYKWNHSKEGKKSIKRFLKKHPEYKRKFRKAHPDKWRAQKKRNYAIGRAFASRGRHDWTISETELLFSFEGTDRELAKKIERSVQAIQVQRSKLNKKAG